MRVDVVTNKKAVTALLRVWLEPFYDGVFILIWAVWAVQLVSVGILVIQSEVGTTVSGGICTTVSLIPQFI